MTEKQKQQMYYFFFLWIGFLFFWNIWLNDIWTANEAFYAEAVREMFENHNFLDIYYNYEPRFNKPPLTYWLMALSSLIFGMTEFAMRLPIVLCGIGSVLLTFLLGKKLHGTEVGLISAFIMAFSIQFYSNSRYASPEIPLTFFFILTLYFFIAGYKDNKWKYIFYSYVALVLTIWVKGYPYLILIGLIVFSYILWDVNFNFKKFFEKLKFLKLHIGITFVLIFGFWWFVYMYLKFGNEFLDVYMQETLKRAIAKESKGLADLIFYPYVILWGFLPYSLSFYFSFFGYLKNWKKIKEISFVFTWFLVMLVVFTIAKGKVPTYFIQAHAALSIMLAYFIVNYDFKNRLVKIPWMSTFFIAGLLILAIEGYLIYAFDLDKLYYIAVAYPFLYAARFKDYIYFPFNSALTLLFVVVISILPIIEKYRPYNQIGRAIDDSFIPQSTPLLVEGRFIHNLPFYTKRKEIGKLSVEELKERFRQKKFLALVKEEDFHFFKNSQVLWIGYIYKKSSESRFAILIKSVLKAKKGDLSKFEKMYLVYRP